jgi:hypothetical protein
MKVAVPGLDLSRAKGPKTQASAQPVECPLAGRQQFGFAPRVAGLEEVSVVEEASAAEEESVAEEMSVAEEVGVDPFADILAAQQHIAAVRQHLKINTHQ